MPHCTGSTLASPDVDSLTLSVAVNALHGQPTCHVSVVLCESASRMFMHIVYKLKRHPTVIMFTVLSISVLM